MRRTLEQRLTEPPPPRWPRIAAGFGAAAVFAALALWLFRDVLPRFDTSYVGGGELEGWMWRYWWMKQLILGAFAEGGFFYGIYVALVSGSYPETGNVFDLQWFSMPMEALIGDPAYYNVKVFAFLVLNGLCGYWLGRVLVGDWTASVLCGVAFGFGSYVLLEIDAGRVRHVGVFPLALYALALMRLQQEESDPWRAAWAGAAFGLCTSMYLYYGMSAAFLSVMWLAALGMPAERPLRYVLVVSGVVVVLGAGMALGWPASVVLGLFGLAMAGLLAWLVLRGGWMRARALLVLAMVAVLTSMPYATWYLEQAMVKKQALREVSYFRDFPPLEFLLNPHNVHATDDNLLNSMQRFRGDSPSWDFPFRPEYRRSAPVVLTVLVIGGLLFLRRRPWLWVGVMLLGYVLSLGPYLKAGTGETYVQEMWGQAMAEGVRLPQALFFKYVPYFSRLFSPIRMQGLFLLGFGVLVAWTVASAFQRLRVPPAWRPLVLVPILALVVLQWGRCNQAPLTWTPVRVPDVYPWIAAQPGDGVVELPFREGDYVNYYQIYHGKRVLEGWGAGSLPERYPMGRTRWLGEFQVGDLPNNGFLRWLRELNGSGPERQASVAWGAADVDRVRSMGYRYAVLHERGCYIVKGDTGAEHYRWMRGLLEKLFGPPVRVSHELIRERRGSDRPPTAEGLYPYEIVVYDIDR